MKRTLLNLLIIALFAAAAAVLLYPTSSDQFSRYQNQRVIAENQQAVESLSEEESTRLLREASAYNVGLTRRPRLVLRDAFDTEEAPPDEESARYLSLLNVQQDGVMGFITIPKIGVEVPIYHTTSDSVLIHGAGHLEGTSLPVGGSSTHAALAGHRGLPSARLFSDLDQLAKGDLFEISVLGQELFYLVDRISVVEPKETQTLSIVPGEDHVTLVTCTPYGINTHRLLIRGTRFFPEQQEDVPLEQLLAQDGGAVPFGAGQMLLYLGVPILAAGLLLMLLLRAFTRRGRRAER